MEVTVNVNQTSVSASLGRARGHQISCDRPEAKGGGDDGAMGGEIFLIGLGGCFMSNLLAAARARGSAADNFTISITGRLEDSPTRFAEVEMRVSADHDDREELEKLVVIAERGCIVANTVKKAVSLSIVVV